MWWRCDRKFRYMNTARVSYWLLATCKQAAGNLTGRHRHFTIGIRNNWSGSCRLPCERDIWLRPRGETMRIGDGTTEHVVVVVVTDLDGSTRQQTHQWAMVTLARPVRFFFRSGCGRTRPRSPKQSFAPVLVRKEGSTGAFVCLSLSSHSYYLRIPTANTVLLE